MELIGTLFRADIPNINSPHFVIITFAIDDNKRIFLVPISSIKFVKLGGNCEFQGKKCKYYDSACVITNQDIPDIITKPSFARYQYAKIIAYDDLDSSFQQKGKVSEELILRLQNGAKNSKELPGIYKNFIKENGL